MPQPFRRRTHNVINMEPNVLLLRPGLAQLMALVAGYWSRLEMVLSQPYAFLLGGDNEAALEKYHSVSSIDRRAALFLQRRQIYPQDLLRTIRV